jgi:hypothetical protein
MAAYYFSHVLQFVLILGLFGAVGGPLIAYVWLHHKRTDKELQLKLTLAERGMSAAEICAIVEAGRRPRERTEEIAEARMI